VSGLRRATWALVGLAACLIAHPAPAAADDAEWQSRHDFDAAPRFVSQLPRAGFTIERGAPVLLVNRSPVDRQVILAFKRPPGDLLTLAHAVADGRRDSCVVEWSIADGSHGSESWWLDRALGLLIARDGATWLARAEGQSAWSLRCPALGATKFGGGYDLVALHQALADADAAPMYSLVDREPERGRGNAGVPSADRVYVEELAEPLAKETCEEPAAARAQGVEGTVLVRALIDTTGTVAETIVVRSVPPLDAVAIACARQLHFKPTLMNNVPVARWVAIPVKFSLN
jgi:TonB family protein